MGKRIIASCFFVNLPFITALCILLQGKTEGPAGRSETGERSGYRAKIEIRQEIDVGKEVELGKEAEIEKEIKIEKEVEIGKEMKIEKEIKAEKEAIRILLPPGEEQKICSISLCRKWEDEDDAGKWVTIVRIVRK